MQRVTWYGAVLFANVAFQQDQAGKIQCFQHPDRFARDFGADAVTGENRYFHNAFHSSIRDSRSRSRTRAAITSPRRSASG